MPEESDQCLQQHKYDQIVIWLTKGHAINKSSWLEIRFFFCRTRVESKTSVNINFLTPVHFENNGNQSTSLTLILFTPRKTKIV